MPFKWLCAKIAPIAMSEATTSEITLNWSWKYAKTGAEHIKSVRVQKSNSCSSRHGSLAVFLVAYSEPNALFVAAIFEKSFINTSYKLAEPVNLSRYL